MKAFSITIDQTIILYNQECLVFQPATLTKQPFLPLDGKWLKDTPSSAMKEISHF